MSKARNLAGFAGSISSNNDLNVGIITATSFVGDITVSAGSTSSPSLKFSASSTTGIYSPGSNQLSLVTAGTGRITIDASGNVVAGGTLTAGSFIPTSSTVPTNGLYLSAANTLALATNSAGRVFIDSSGRLGLGSSSPSEKCEISDTSGNAQLRLTGTGGYTNLYSDGNFYVQPNGATKLVVTSAGNLGVGTASPAQALDVAGSIKATGQFLAGSTGAATPDYSFVADNTLGMFRAPGRLGFSTGGTERATIDSSGRLLVGTSSTSATTTLLLQGYSGTTGPGIARLCTTSVTPTSGEDLGYVIFGDSAHSNGAWINAQRDGGTWSGSSKPTRLVFSTTADGASSPTERMRIGQSGQIGTYTTGNYAFGVNTSASAGTSQAIYFGNRNSSDASGTGGTTVYYVWSNGNVQNTNGSFTAISDAKLKENIIDASSQWNDLKAIQIRNWNFKSETGHETHRQIGPIAQELETVCPGLVFETPDRDADGNETGEVTKGVNYSVLYMKAVKALQEAMERIETLESSNADLLARVTALETP